jgi:sulfur-carrier protein
MPRVVFGPALQRHIVCPPATAQGSTVREALDAVFADNAPARLYVLDDQSGLRKHMAIFVNGGCIKDRVHLSDAVGSNDEIYVLQSLSGG